MTPHSQEALQGLPPLANAIVDRAIDNVTRKLVAGYRNKNNSRPNAKSPDIGAVAKDTLDATSASSVMAVANRGAAWKEMLQKSLSHGISSISTMKFDGAFTVQNGQPQGLDAVPNSPGVYVVFNKNGEAVYVGDSAKLKQRWYAGHLNEHKQGQGSDKPYKLAEEFQEGCTVKFVQMESEATAAALEAHLIKTDKPKKNARQELKTEQGTRSNIEAKKMKDASGGVRTLAAGAAKEAAVNVGWNVFEQLASALTKALKDELVEIVRGVSRSIKFRLKRLFDRVWSVIQAIIDAPLKILAGIFEFVVNAVSKTIAQFYSLAKNIYDLGLSAWQLFQGAQTMNTEALVEKVTETIVLSGTLILWDALDPVLEANLATVVGPVAPYLSAAICAIGYGLSSFYLQKFVPAMVKMLLAMKSGAQEAVQEMRAACEKLITIQERELRLLEELKDYAEESFRFEDETRKHIRALGQHEAIEPLDIQGMLAIRKQRHG
jgi:hypothetical protein